ncbi:hypothetical protein ANN_21607 [Periplaneta americana]|uniref:Uncharacterized protein n=1 Tax=Periplaneta americana TaxID=6978 RepID=A0ABQ8S682_PERAM|nr:hypothetical protein ANN_21607 [Periplaneta americana]
MEYPTTYRKRTYSGQVVLYSALYGATTRQISTIKSIVEMAKPKPAMQLQERMETIEGQMVTLLPLVKEVRILKEFLSHLLSQSREQDCRKCESFLKEGNEALSREKQLKQDLEQRCAELEVQLQQQQTRCAELEAQVQQEQARRTEAESQVQQQETRGAKQIPEPSADVKQFLQSVRGTNNLKLIEAAKSGNTAAVQHLASAGVKVNICDESGFTPLHHAAEGGHTETVRVLLALRANVNARTSDKVTPLHRAALKGHEAVCDALLFAGADVNMCTARYESSPLHYAAESGALSVVQLLVCYGASCYSRNKYNHTSLEVAILRELSLSCYLFVYALHQEGSLALHLLSSPEFTIESHRCRQCREA